MRPRIVSMMITLNCVAALAASAAAGAQPFGWAQWGQNSQHTLSVDTVGQPAIFGPAGANILNAATFDPFVADETADPLTGGGLLVHYQTPLLDGDTIYMGVKSGTYTSITSWQTQTWNEERLDLEHGALAPAWTFASDWKPVPRGTPLFGPSFEPVFHAALSPFFVYVPGFGGSVYKLSKRTGAVLAHFQPFGETANPNIYLTGAVTVDALGNIYYLAIQLAAASSPNPWTVDVAGSWIVKIDVFGNIHTATIASLTPGAPQATDQCPGSFNLNNTPLPWPPTPTTMPASVPCGTQRVAVNSAPAVALDGTIYFGVLAHLDNRVAYLLAVTPELKPKWKASLLERFNDGCNVLLPPNGTPGGCAAGATTGFEPAANAPGSGRLLDDSTASPVVAPDGSIFYGTYSRYNYAQGHLVKISREGDYMGEYPFGVDETPAIYEHDGTYSVIQQDNHFGGVGSYCNNPAFCPPERTAASPEAYFITQLSRDLVPEWSYQNTNTQACARNPDNSITCVPSNPASFQFTANAPAVDVFGVVYATSLDGNLYVVNQGGTLRTSAFLEETLGAEPTPVSISTSGRVFAENAGMFFVIGRF